MKPFVTTMIAIALGCALAGCASTETTDDANVSMGMINETCPIMEGNAVDPNGPYVEYNGAKVGFCCAGCDTAFNNWSDERKQAYIAAQKK